MTTITATDMKQSFWARLQNVKTESITITKNNQNFAVLMDYNEYSHLKQLEEHEDILFGLAANQAIKNWMSSIEETNNLLSSIK